MKALALLLLPLLLAAGFQNPVTSGTVDTFPDPTMIRAKDGRWYAYGTTNPIFNSRGETGEHILPMLVSDNLTQWSYLGDVFALDAKPAWWPAGTRLWAPDIRYLDGVYHLTYSLSVGGIGLATSTSPTGPWTDRGQILGTNNGCPTGTIDQAVFTDSDGTHYLYWGSYDTVCVARMNADATAITGAVTQIGRGRRMEGALVVHRDGYYYLFYSDGSCCDGGFSGYVTKVARATSPLGPFRTPSGLDLMSLTSKDGIVVAGDGHWVGPGHNTLVTDLAGQDWLVYHAIPVADPDFPPVTGANGQTLRLTKRPMLIDRLDWIGGWPVVRAGAGPSSGVTEAPVTSSVPTTGNIRIEADVLGSGGLSMAGGKIQIALSSQLSVTVSGVVSSAALPANFDHSSWHNVAVERRGRALHVSVTSDRLPMPLASLDVTLPTGVGNGAYRGVGTYTNLSAAPLHTPVQRRVADPVPGALQPAFTDEFNGSGLGAGWSWVRPPSVPPAVTGGSLVWPTQGAELAGGTNTASVLLRDTPAAPFMVETKVNFDGTRGNQQAGLILYDNDDRWVKLVHSVLPLNNGNGAVLQQTEFTKEDTRPSQNAVFSGPMFGGPATPTLWLRLLYNGTTVRMASSTDGFVWEWGGAWSLPAAPGRPLRVGLISLNATGATGTFDYVRTHRVRSGG